jgi:hypothetical protein
MYLCNRNLVITYIEGEMVLVIYNHIGEIE